MSDSPSVFSRLVAKLVDYQHVLIIILSVFLISTSGWILMGRGLRNGASIWDYLHVYLGLITAALSFSMLVICCIKGRWRQMFPWLLADFSQLNKDLFGLAKGKIPLAGGRGLYSCIEGLGILLLVGVGFTGVIWFCLQGSSDALMWRGYHILLVKGFIGFFLIHVFCACLHLLDFIRN
ncbi:Prokaryotic cytochrome b561 [Shewanella psychrophila]|uniref:Prokaryotic cytochrome b561 n=1 Tax=Shewanella psychrophila TaxID=225848 RepID=A0A1S6HQY6_9GAMM|nr:cytochrome b/b6 domain-containing protein [Shewanella psychrophila]AQS37933.1 Prokaryotic cytochrome b561 [Shewanella psychrophila]